MLECDQVLVASHGDDALHLTVVLFYGQPAVAQEEKPGTKHRETLKPWDFEMDALDA